MTRGVEIASDAVIAIDQTAQRPDFKHDILYTYFANRYFLLSFIAVSVTVTVF